MPSEGEPRAMSQDQGATSNLDLIGRYCPERSRHTTYPGGCECNQCGCIFIGAPDDGLCRVCYEEWRKEQ